MTDIKLEIGEGILLQTSNANLYDGHNEIDIDELYLTNRNIIYVHDISLGLFKSETVVGKISLSSVAVINGIVQVTQVNDADYGKTLQIIYNTGARELLKFNTSPKKQYPIWKDEITNAVSRISSGIPVQPPVPIPTAIPAPPKLDDTNVQGIPRSSESPFFAGFKGVANDMKQSFIEIAQSARDTFRNSSESSHLPTDATDDSLKQSNTSANQQASVSAVVSSKAESQITCEAAPPSADQPTDKHSEPVKVEPQYMFCCQCGKKLTVDSRFCTACGAKTVELVHHSVTPPIEPITPPVTDTPLPTHQNASKNASQTPPQRKLRECPHCGNKHEPSSPKCPVCKYNFKGTTIPIMGGRIERVQHAKADLKAQWSDFKKEILAAAHIHGKPEEIVATQKCSNYLLLEYSAKSSQGVYEVLDVNRVLQYTAKEAFWFSKHHLTVFHKSAKICEIKKEMYVAPDIDNMHTKRHICTILKDGKVINKIESHRSSKKQYFQATKGSWRITFDQETDSFVLRRHSVEEARLNVSTRNKMVIGYNTKADEEEIVLLAITLFQIFKALDDKGTI